MGRSNGPKFSSRRAPKQDGGRLCGTLALPIESGSPALVCLIPVSSEARSSGTASEVWMIDTQTGAHELIGKGLEFEQLAIAADSIVYAAMPNQVWRYDLVQNRAMPPINLFVARFYTIEISKDDRQLFVTGDGTAVLVDRNGGEPAGRWQFPSLALQFAGFDGNRPYVVTGRKIPQMIWLDK